MPEQNQGYKSITGLVDIPAIAATPVAQTTQTAGVQRCSICSSLIAGKPLMVKSKLACSRCASEANAGQSADSSSNFTQGLVFGIIAAVLGMGIYAGFTIITHFYLGYVALAVGWIVGKAIMVGSKGVGGQRYQIAAVLLTYAAISLAAIPIHIARMLEQGVDIDWASAAPDLALWGVASPFLRLQAGPAHIIGLVILFVGLRVAYRVTAAKGSVVAAVAAKK
jgi:hypothetical protein